MNRFTTVTIANSEAARSALLEAENPTPESVVVLELAGCVLTCAPAIGVLVPATVTTPLIVEGDAA